MLKIYGRCEQTMLIEMVTLEMKLEEGTTQPGIHFNKVKDNDQGKVIMDLNIWLNPGTALKGSGKSASSNRVLRAVLCRP